VQEAASLRLLVDVAERFTLGADNAAASAALKLFHCLQKQLAVKSAVVFGCLSLIGSIRVLTTVSQLQKRGIIRRLLCQHSRPTSPV
jgi:hypothetical protein